MTVTIERKRHNSITYYYVNYAGLSGDNYTQTIRDNTNEFINIGSSGENDILMIVDVKDSVIGPDQLEAFKKSMRDITPYTRAIAVLGTTGLKKALLNFLNRMVGIVEGKAFHTMEEALEWLVSQQIKNDMT